MLFRSDDGFDGVYLDIIDAWEYWSDEDNGEGFCLEPGVAAARMINLVKVIAEYARTTCGKTDFLIFPQNGEPILEYDTGLEENVENDFLNVISGIGIEDLFYNETDLIDAETTSFRTAFLDIIAGEGKKVIVVDYVDDGSESETNLARIASFRTKVTDAGYLPYAALTDRALDLINPQD